MNNNIQNIFQEKIWTKTTKGRAERMVTKTDLKEHNRMSFRKINRRFFYNKNTTLSVKNIAENISAETKKNVPLNGIKN
jgi:hypothetical protein